jgi:hypothetical protein
MPYQNENPKVPVLHENGKRHRCRHGLLGTGDRHRRRRRHDGEPRWRPPGVATVTLAITTMVAVTVIVVGLPRVINGGLPWLEVRGAEARLL